MKIIVRIIVVMIVAYFAGAAVAQTSTSPAVAQPTGEVAPTAPITMSKASAPAATSDAPKLSLMFSPYTYHVENKPTHRPVFLLGIEREHANAKLNGVVLFRNSFGQPSVYVYPWGGAYKSILGINDVSFKWTGGLIYGYKGEFKDEVANWKGLAPVIIVGLAYEVKPGWSVQVNSLGKLAAQLQFNMALH